MSFLQLAYIMARRRIAVAWRLELVLFLGIVLSVAILSGSVVFSDLLAEAALRRTLQDAEADEVNFWVRIYQNLEESSIASQRTSVYQAGIDFVERRITPPFSPYLEGQARLLETATFFFVGDPRFDLPQDARPRGRVQFLTGISEEGRSELVEGHWPGESADIPGGTDGSGPVLEAAIEVAGAELVGLTVGEELDIIPATSVLHQQTSRVRIVGLFRRVDPDDDFWYGRDHNFSHHNGQWATVPLFTSEATILEQIANTYPGIYSNVTWIFDLDRQSVRAGDVDSIKASVRGARNDIYANLDNSSVGIKLERLLDRYSELLLLSRIPLFLMVFLVTGILAYYLALVSGLTIRSRSAEIAMLKSRGATTLQVGLMVLVEGLLLAIPAVIIGAFLAPPAAGILGSFFFDIEANRALISLSSPRPVAGGGRRPLVGNRPYPVHPGRSPAGNRGVSADRRPPTPVSAVPPLLPGLSAAGLHRSDLVADTEPRHLSASTGRLGRAGDRLHPAAGAGAGAAGDRANRAASISAAGCPGSPDCGAVGAGVAGTGLAPSWPRSHSSRQPGGIVDAGHGAGRNWQRLQFHPRAQPGGPRPLRSGSRPAGPAQRRPISHELL